LLIHVTGTTGLAHGVHLGLLTGVGFIAAAMGGVLAIWQ
jgi:hypothetical protein